MNVLTVFKEGLITIGAAALFGCYAWLILPAAIIDFIAHKIFGVE